MEECGDGGDRVRTSGGEGGEEGGVGTGRKEEAQRRRGAALDFAASEYR